MRFWSDSSTNRGTQYVEHFNTNRQQTEGAKLMHRSLKVAYRHTISSKVMIGAPSDGVRAGVILQRAPFDRLVEKSYV